MSHLNIDPAVVIRAARCSDDAALRRLARLDSRRALAGDVVVGEQDGEVVAALSTASGESIADPFRPTANVVDLLRTHTGQTRRSRRPRRALAPRTRAA